jgi:predicted dehydrogenase
MGRWHAYYSRRGGALVSAFVDRDNSAAAALQARFPDARVFGDLADCLATCPVDVVHVCTGIESHGPLTEIALSAGKHVLVEKPAAESAAETARLLALAQSNHRSLIPVHQFPFQRGFQQLRRHVHRLGEIVRIGYQVSSAGGDGRSAGERKRILWEILPHPISLFFALLGKELEGASWHVQRYTGDDLEISGNLRDTQLAVLLSLRARPIRNELIVSGTNATAYLNLFHGYGVLDTGETSRLSKASGPFKESLCRLVIASANLARRTWNREPAYPGLAELIRKFYQAIGGLGCSPVSSEEILCVATFMDHVWGNSISQRAS